MGIMRVKPVWPEKNTQDCPVCKERRRFPCRSRITGKVMYKTHKTMAKKHRDQKK